MQNEPPAQFHVVCRVQDIPKGEARMFVVNENLIGLFHIGDTFMALANECPHAGASLAHGLIQEDTVACRIHHWRFSIRTGQYLDENRPECNVRTYPVRVEGERVLVGLPANGGNT